jgi:hypothetical protein
VFNSNNNSKYINNNSKYSNSISDNVLQSVSYSNNSNNNRFNNNDDNNNNNNNNNENNVNNRFNNNIQLLHHTSHNHHHHEYATEPDYYNQRFTTPTNHPIYHNNHQDPRYRYQNSNQPIPSSSSPSSSGYNNNHGVYDNHHHESQQHGLPHSQLTCHPPQPPVHPNLQNNPIIDDHKQNNNHRNQIQHIDQYNRNNKSISQLHPEIERQHDIVLNQSFILSNSIKSFSAKFSIEPHCEIGSHLLRPIDHTSLQMQLSPIHDSLYNIFKENQCFFLSKLEINSNSFRNNLNSLSNKNLKWESKMKNLGISVSNKGMSGVRFLQGYNNNEIITLSPYPILPKITQTQGRTWPKSHINHTITQSSILCYKTSESTATLSLHVLASVDELDPEDLTYFKIVIAVLV